MERKIIKLDYSDPAVTLTGFLPEGERKPAILVLPGGGYAVCAPAEGKPIAERFAEAGWAAFVLNYSTASTGAEHAVFPEPLREVAQTVKHLRENAADYGLDPGRLALCGASAGGHLAMSYANGWDTPEVYEGFTEAGGAEILRPDACVLLYAASAPGADGSRMLPILFGHEAPFSEEEIERCAVKNYVGPQTPPTVLFHSATDPMVPVRCSVELFETLQSEEIPSEIHVFGSGGHGYGPGAGTPAGAWPDLALAFLDALFSRPEIYNWEYQRQQMEEMFKAFQGNAE